MVAVGGAARQWVTGKQTKEQQSKGKWVSAAVREHAVGKGDSNWGLEGHKMGSGQFAQGPAKKPVWLVENETV